MERGNEVSTASVQYKRQLYKFKLVIRASGSLIPSLQCQLFFCCFFSQKEKLAVETWNEATSGYSQISSMVMFSDCQSSDQAGNELSKL